MRRMRDSVHAVRQSMMAIGRPPPVPPKQNQRTQNQYQPDADMCNQPIPIHVAPVSSHKIPTTLVPPTPTKPQAPPQKKSPQFDIRTAALKPPIVYSEAPETPPIPPDRPPAAVQLPCLMKTKHDKRESRYACLPLCILCLSAGKDICRSQRRTRNSGLYMIGL